MAFYVNKLKELRRAHKMTQTQLADDLGLSKGAISMYETGKRIPEFETLELICDYFNIPMDWLTDKSPYKMEYQNELTAQEQELLAIFRQLDAEQQNAVLVLVKSLAK